MLGQAAAEKIREKKAKHVLAVKENQPTLCQEVKAYRKGLETGEIRDRPEDTGITTEEGGRGRIEKREVETVTDRGRQAGNRW